MLFRSMSTITRNGLDKYLTRTENPLVITPILSSRQFGESSVDVRLGNQFIVFRAHRFGIFEPAGLTDLEPQQIQERQILPYGEKLVLHPGMLVLGSTFEYVSMPNDLECQIEGRSSWARIGLQIATATAIEPGFKGVITLELSNFSTVPIKLMPGIRIAQLLFRKAEPEIPNPYSGNRKYRCPIGPEFSRLQNDYDWEIFSK